MKAFEIAVNSSKGADVQNNKKISIGKSMKNMLSLILALSLCLGLCACGGSSTSTGTSEPTPAASEATTEALPETTENIGKVVIYTPTEDYLIEYLQGRLDEALLH